MTVPSLVSVNLGRLREVRRGAETLMTGIFKFPTSGPVEVGAKGLEGDHVADLRVHGGPRKAVYAYPSEHYAPWSAELGLTDLPWGSFGENLTTRGISERELYPGDRLLIGTARLTVVQPRNPCIKLNARFEREDMIERFLRSRRSGVYLGVDATGTISAGDLIRVEPGPRDAPSILDEFDRHAARVR